MISVIIVSYNVKSYLRQCIKTIKRSICTPAIEIIIVDNYSFDNSSKMVAKEFPGIKIIQNSKNLGYAKAVNQGNNLGDWNI